jgi:phosphohistidine phosphatase
MTRHRLIPDLVLVSPAKRTVETWALVAAAFSKAPRVVKDDRIYNAGAETLAQLIRETDDARSLLLVGHNPGLHDLATELIGSGDVEARESLKEKLPTSGLVVIDFAFEGWSELHDNAGRLERFVTPRSIGTPSD